MMTAGAPSGLVPCGLGARDTLRLEKGFCLHGNDIGPGCNPVEAGLSWTVGWKTDFRGKEALQAVRSAGAARKLVGFTMAERGIPRKDYVIQDPEGNDIGVVTSGDAVPFSRAGDWPGLRASGLGRKGVRGAHRHPRKGRSRRPSPGFLSFETWKRSNQCLNQPRRKGAKGV